MADHLLPQQRTGPADLFPCPADGETVEVTPPNFNWLAVGSAASYRVLVEDAAGRTVVDQTIARNYLLLRRPLAPGPYRWDLRTPDGRARGWWNFTVADDAHVSVAPTADEVLAAVPPSHPRHIYYPADIPAVVARHGPQIEVLKRNAAAALTAGPPPRPRFHRDDAFVDGRPGYRAAFGQYRDFVDRDLVACALAHLLLNDARAAAHARASLLEICDWNPEGPCAVDGAWGDEIGLSNVRCLFAVYDWTFDLFTPREHAYIRATLVAYARQILRRLETLDFFTHPGHSHAGRLPAYLGQAALVLHGHADPGEVRAWLQYALDVYGSFFPFYGGRDGGWAEGTFYATSYTKWYLPFFFAVERHTGFSFLDHRPFYRRASQFFLHFAPPGWETHPFGDGYWCRPDDAEWPGFFAQDPLGAYADRFGPPLARTFSSQLSGSVELFKLHLLDVFRTPAERATRLSAGPAENSRAFPDTGFVSIHSDLARPDNDTAVLARASRFGAGSHRHADQGNFAIISRGRGLITPSGYFGQGYGTVHHARWTRQTRAHNCPLIDGQGQPDHSHTAVGRVVALRDAGHWAVAELDVSAAYTSLRVFRRWIVMLRPDVVIIADDLVADRPVRIDWLAHTLSRPEIAGDVVSVTRPPASMRMQLFAAGGAIAPTCADEFPPDAREGLRGEVELDLPPQFHLTWCVAAPTARRRFAAVVAVNGAIPGIDLRNGVLEVRTAAGMLRVQLEPGDSLDMIQIDGEAAMESTKCIEN